MDAHFAPGAFKLFHERGRKQLSQRTANGVSAADAAQALHLGIPAFDAIIKTRCQNADADGFDDVFAEFLEPLVLVHFLFQGKIEVGVLGGDADVVGQR